MSDLYGEQWEFVLLISFLITWGIGLTPPVLIRYIFLRRPLNRKSASWVAAGFSAFFWIAFLAINNALGEKPSTAGTGTVWIFMFFVARWIMSRGYIPSPIAVEISEARKN